MLRLFVASRAAFVAGRQNARDSIVIILIGFLIYFCGSNASPCDDITKH